MTDSTNKAPSPPTSRPQRQLLAVVASGLVGALALATSTYNGYLQRQQVRAQAWPHLALGANLGNDGFTISVVNRGVGPPKSEIFA